MTTPTLEQIKQLIITTMQHQGGAINEWVVHKIAEAINLQTVDIDALQAAVTDILAAVDGDPDKPGYQFLINLQTRLSAIELKGAQNADAIAQANQALASAVNDYNAKIDAEVAARQQALIAANARIDGLQTAINQETQRASEKDTQHTAALNQNSANISSLQTDMSDALTERTAIRERLDTLESGKVSNERFNAFLSTFYTACVDGFGAFLTALTSGAAVPNAQYTAQNLANVLAGTGSQSAGAGGVIE